MRTEYHRRPTRAPEEIRPYLVARLEPYSIMGKIAALKAIPFPQIFSKIRKGEIVLARHLMTYFMTMNEKLTLKQIASLIGFDCHTTVLHSRNTIEGWIETNREFRKEVIRAYYLLINTNYD